MRERWERDERERRTQTQVGTDVQHLPSVQLQDISTDGAGAVCALVHAFPQLLNLLVVAFEASLNVAL